MPILHIRFIVFLSFFLLVSGCAKHTLAPGGETQLVLAQKRKTDSVLETQAPAFYLQNTHKSYNRIGQVTATGNAQTHQITINPNQPVFYVAALPFTTPKSSYTNLIYRVHFLKQPFSLFPFHLGAGNHVGLLVILTLDAKGHIILVTTAQTCGCYALTLPTRTLPPEAFPPHWPLEPHAKIGVYGEELPSILPALTTNDLLTITLRPEVHRVMDISVSEHPLTTNKQVYAALTAFNYLKNLPLEDSTTTSLYHSSGPLRGHVKGAIKPWETILLGIISFDFFVGMDKEYGDTTVSGNPFYTSLKVWNRNVSDMNDFAGYLKFNGWQL